MTSKSTCTWSPDNQQLIQYFTSLELYVDFNWTSWQIVRLSQNAYKFANIKDSTIDYKPFTIRYFQEFVNSVSPLSQPLVFPIEIQQP